jgi:alkaline phosphatase
MKWNLLCIPLIFIGLYSSAQPLLHAHNDYQKPEPLTNALRNKVFSIEADVFLVNNTLRVAHDKKELNAAPALQSLYLKPIIDLFGSHNNQISDDINYAPKLVIDIKENGEAVLAELTALLSSHRSYFDRSINAKAMQVVISGDRGPVSKWTSYPSYIFFDGRPYEVYDSATLQRIAFISDSYLNYSRPTDSTDFRLQQLVEKVHRMNKQLRLWAIQDNAESWNHLHQLGVDIINTDRVEECRKYFFGK